VRLTVSASATSRPCSPAVAGGPDNTAELYNPASGAWTETGALNIERTDHIAALLADGRVLVSGGRTANGLTATAELFNPTTGRWDMTRSMSEPISSHSASPISPRVCIKPTVCVQTPRVLVVGGSTDRTISGSAEVFDPAPSAGWAPAACLHPCATRGRDTP
jgi:hypothetical protein